MAPGYPVQAHKIKKPPPGPGPMSHLLLVVDRGQLTGSILPHHIADRSTQL